MFQVSLYGMCLGFDGVQATERTRRIDWLTQNVRALTGEILKAREVFKEAPPTQPPEEVSSFSKVAYRDIFA